MGLLFKNNAETTLSSGINNSTTTIPVASAAVFPTPDTNNKFFATLDDGTNVETVLVTAISSNDLTVVRAQDNTSAAAFGGGAKIELRLNAKVLDMGTSSLTDLDGDTKIQVEESADEDIIRFDVGGSEKATLNGSGLTVGDITINGSTISDGGDLTLDVEGDIILDANGGDITFKDDGLLTATLSRSVGNFEVTVNQSDGDFVLKGNDGGSPLTAITVDMSNGGEAIFYGGIDIAANTDIELNDGNWTGEKTNKIQAHANNLYLQYNTSGGLFFRNSGGNDRASLDSSGNFTTEGNVTAYGSVSDKRLKENIEVIENPIEKIKDLKGVTFNYKKDGSKSTGLIAQDLQKVLPEAVYTSKTIADETKGEKPEEHLAIHYGNTVGLLVEAIKEQQEQIETLTAKVKELEDK